MDNLDQPQVVTDLRGRGYTASDHGPLTPKERREYEYAPLSGFEPDQQDYLVRWSERSPGRQDLRLFTPEGARALAEQLIAAADQVESRRAKRTFRDILDGVRDGSGPA